MSKSPNQSEPERFSLVAEAVCERLANNKHVRRTLPDGGRLRFDRQLPFLCIYRSPPQKDAGTRELVTTEAAYLFASGEDTHRPSLSQLCQRIAATMQEHFGVFLFIEIWAEDDPAESVGSRPGLQPGFTIVTPDEDSLPSTIDAFTEALAKIKIGKFAAQVRTRPGDGICPPGLRPLAHACPDTSAACFVLGLAVRPIFRDPQTGVLFPMVLQALRSQLSRALRKAISQFNNTESTAKHGHYESLGPTSLVQAARLVDQQLCEVSESFDFLLQATPTNSDATWADFQKSNYRREPALYYRPLPYNPRLLKRRLYDIEIERIEDPTLAHLFWEKQDEIDRQLAALRDIGTPHFLYCSLQLYGAADDALIELATDILDRIAAESTSASAGGDCLPTNEIVARAREEIDYYHQQANDFTATIEVCDHITSGIMVSHDRLLIADTVQITSQRITPLLHHEIGTHLLTYFNGRRQPFRQLYAGLAGYDELQEGLAVMAEYLTGGLTAHRLRTLAGRVVAARSMTDGATFVETFMRLRETHEFTPREAFITTLRAYRGGGLTKDVIYLRGLRDLLKYLGKGHDIQPLYVGKIGLQHLPYVQEMRRRGIVDAPGVLPRFWEDAGIRDRLEACRGLSIVDLVETES